MADYIPEIPDFIAKIYGSRRYFKRDKRRELRKLAKALDDFRSGCAYIPDGSTRVTVIASQIDAMMYDLSVTSWGR